VAVKSDNKSDGSELKVAARPDRSTLVGLAIGPLGLIACGILGCTVTGQRKDIPVTLLIEFAGISGGAFLGFLASPKAAGEQASFLTFAKAISAFLSGYALSKIDHLIDTLFQGDIYKDQLVAARMMIFFVAVIISFMTAYSYRVYIQKIPEQDGPKENPQNGEPQK
jgi:hypothetical protein